MQTRDLTAFMEIHPVDSSNPIHSSQGAVDYGFQAALVGGASVYGWAAPVAVAQFGERWLSEGWAQVRFRQPVYPGEAVHIALGDDGNLNITAQRQKPGTAAEEVVCVQGQMGLGRASWFDDLAYPDDVTPAPAVRDRPRLTPATVPVGKDLVARSVDISAEEMRAFAEEKEAETEPLLLGDRPMLHPAWTASQLIFLLHHSFEYGPAIHTASHIQHLAPAYSDQRVVVAARCVDAYERKGHQYIVNDGVLIDEAGVAVTRLRHTAIYQVAKRG